MPKALRRGVIIFLIAASAGAGAGQTTTANPQTIFAEAQRALMAHDYSKAEQGFRALLKLDPHSVAAHSNLGVVYLRLGRYDAAIAAFRNARELAPQVRGLDLNLGLAYYHKGDYAKATPLFAHVLEALTPARRDRRRILVG